jgi:uncharacterized cupredoxin-like copper-binding protein
MVKFRIAFLVLVAAAAVSAWALPAGAQPRATSAKVTVVTVTAGKPSEFRFKLSKSKVPTGTVVFKVKNVGQIVHDFKINGKKTKNLAPGKSQAIKVTFKKAGKYAYLCTVTGHAAAGMKGTLTVK